MTARVLNPALLSEFCRMRSPVRSAAAIGAASPSRPALAKIKRDLFGPVEKDEFKKFFDTEINKHQQRASDRWGFNFARGHPLADHQQYMWERVPPPTSAVPPHVYTLSHAAHVRHTAAGLLSSPRKGAPAASFRCYEDEDRLLDERARRANAYVLPLMLDTTLCSEDDDGIDLDSSTGSADSSICSPNSTMGSPEPVTTKTRLSLVITAAPSTPSTSNSAACAANSMPTLRASTRQQRQPRITDYLKERKRLSATPKKVSPSKRTRLNSSLSRVA